MSSKQLGTQGVIKKQVEHVTSTGISGIPNKSGHCNQYTNSIGIVATPRSDGNIPLKLINVLSETYDTTGWRALRTLFEGIFFWGHRGKFPHQMNIQAEIDRLFVNKVKGGWTNSKVASDLRRHDARLNERCNESDSDAWGNRRSFDTHTASDWTGIPDKMIAFRSNALGTICEIYN